MSMGNEHHYAMHMIWTGNRGPGTSGYRDYDRSYELTVDGKPMLLGSADATFRGDRTKWNPEEMLVGALVSCHMLAYLHLCADAGITVLEYTDDATGSMVVDSSAGRFTRVVLRPQVVLVYGSDTALAEQLHHRAHELCFIANSVNFPVECEPRTTQYEVSHA